MQNSSTTNQTTIYKNCAARSARAYRGAHLSRRAGTKPGKDVALWVLAIFLSAVWLLIKAKEMSDCSERSMKLLIYDLLLFFATASTVLVLAARQFVEANVDALTGALNRAGLSVFVRVMSWLLIWRPSWVSMLAVDIDYFKSVNDRHGHGAGDEVLCRVAEILKKSTRRFDVIVRQGGDEFMVILLGGTPRTCRLVARRIQRNARHCASRNYGASLSVGAISVWVRQFSFENFFKEVDLMLYHAKQSGRNRTSLKTISGIDDIDSIVVVDG